MLKLFPLCTGYNPTAGVVLGRGLKLIVGTHGFADDLSRPLHWGVD